MIYPPVPDCHDAYAYYDPGKRTGRMVSSSSYILPHNASETERLDFQHKVLTRTFRGLHHAPLDEQSLHRALDVGCGTGNWAIDLAQKFPSAEVLGFDLNTHSASWATAPSNCTFHAADLESAATWAGLGVFEYIHMRHVAPACRDWPRLLARCFEHLAPGGWLEIREFRYPLVVLGGGEGEGEQGAPVEPEGCELLRWSKSMIVATSRNGLDFQIMDKFPALLPAAGFDSVRFEDFRMCIGPWPEDAEDRELGEWHRDNLSKGVPHFSRTVFTRELGWSEEQFDGYIEGVVEEMRSQPPRFRSYFPLKVCVARKPE